MTLEAFFPLPVKKREKKTRKVLVLDRNSLGIATTFHTQSQVHNNAGK